MNEPTMQMIAIGVLVLLLCLRRRRTGVAVAQNAECGTRDEEARAADEAFLQYNNFNDFP